MYEIRRCAYMCTTILEDWIWHNTTPAKGRKLVVEVLETTMDFVKLFADFGINMEGLSNTAGQPGPNVWRVVPRSDVSSFQRCEEWSVANTNKAWSDMGENELDAILLLKHAMSARFLSQMPLLVTMH